MIYHHFIVQDCMFIEWFSRVVEVTHPFFASLAGVSQLAGYAHYKLIKNISPPIFTIKINPISTKPTIHTVYQNVLILPRF